MSAYDKLPKAIRDALKEGEAIFYASDIFQHLETRRCTVPEALRIIAGQKLEYRALVEQVYRGLRKDLPK